VSLDRLRTLDGTVSQLTQQVDHMGQKISAMEKNIPPQKIIAELQQSVYFAAHSAENMEEHCHEVALLRDQVKALQKIVDNLPQRVADSRQSFSATPTQFINAVGNPTVGGKIFPPKPVPPGGMLPNLATSSTQNLGMGHSTAFSAVNSQLNAEKSKSQILQGLSRLDPPGIGRGTQFVERSNSTQPGFYEKPQPEYHPTGSIADDEKSLDQQGYEQPPYPTNPNFRRNTTGGFGGHNHGDMKTLLEISRKFRPEWDGNPLRWKKFWRDWVYYWELRGPGFEGNQEINEYDEEAEYAVEEFLAAQNPVSDRNVADYAYSDSDENDYD